jgi:hypothetical protein
MPCPAWFANADNTDWSATRRVLPPADGNPGTAAEDVLGHVYERDSSMTAATAITSGTFALGATTP